MVSTLFRYFLLASVAAVAYLVLFKPRQLGRLGRGARTVGYAYVAAILISAALRLIFGWWT